MYELGDADAPALLYLHGGPGMGCHEFVRWQGTALAAGVHLIAFDQRGFHHSDPIGTDEPLDEDVFVEDCEALREALGVESWFVLGHSYGGRLAARYAARHPANIRGVIFENPAWNIESTQRHRMPVFASIYERHGRLPEAQACRAFAASPDMFAEDPLRMDLIRGMERLGEAWYLYDRSDTGLLEAAALDRLDEEADTRAAETLYRDPLNSEDLRPLLGGLRVPARLIVGEADLVTSPDQIASFAAAFGPGSVRTVAEAGHFVQGERPEIYARIVLDFVGVGRRGPGSAG